MDLLLADGALTRSTVAPPSGDRVRGSPQAIPLGRRNLKRAAQLSARADAELREHLVQVVFDGSRADEELSPDLGVRVTLRREPGNLCLLRSELVARVDRALARRLARRKQFACGARAKRFGAHGGEQLVRRAQLLAGVDAAV